MAAVAQSELASLALSRVLHFDNAVSIDLLLHLASHNPEVLRWAIRYSKLFERTTSPLWLALRAALVGDGLGQFCQIRLAATLGAQASLPSGVYFSAHAEAVSDAQGLLHRAAAAFPGSDPVHRRGLETMQRNAIG
ncbi:MAG TPA: hypothetical protein DIC26_20000 [Pseudomonas sp.]|nr:hypothetical protein [Pseudomonas sp.]